MTTIKTENSISTSDRHYNEMKVSVVKKAVQLLEEDLFEDVTDSSSQAYFNERVTYLFMVASAGDSNILTARYLRSLHSIFNNYYHSCRALLSGIEFTAIDKERQFLYQDVIGQIENFLLDL